MGNFAGEVEVGRPCAGALSRHCGAGHRRRELQPTEYLYGQDRRVLTHQQFDAHWSSGPPKCRRQAAPSSSSASAPGRRSIPTAAGSAARRGEARPHLKDLNPDMNVFILYRDMRTYGLLEDYYRAPGTGACSSPASTRSMSPRWPWTDGSLKVTFVDHVLGCR